MDAFSNINTIKYLDKSGKYKVKTPKDKSFKTYDYVMKKENLSILRKQQRKKKKHLENELEKNINSLKKLFLIMLNLDISSKKYKELSKHKNKIIKQIKSNIDSISNIEVEQNHTGTIAPVNIIYANRHIKI